MLTITLTRGAPEYAQIVEQIRLAVARGELRPGERLASVRELADRLGVNPSTAARAYRELEQAGVIETHGRRGTLVAQESNVEGLRQYREARLRGLAERAVVEALAQGFTPDEIEAAFGLQLAAWREQRGPHPTPAMPRAPDRLMRFAGSHDLALEALWAQARLAHPAAAFTAAYVGSLDGLLALLHGEAGLAGAHILDEETGEYNLPILRRLFPGGQVCAVTLAEREQGLIVAAGNPQGVHSLADLARGDLRFINRQPGSGTRTLLEHRLRVLGLTPAHLAGYDRVAATHMAVATAIAQGHADAGLGVRAAAQAFGLDFLPVATERYDLVCYVADRDQPPLAPLFDLLASAAFRRIIAQLDGYHAAHTGEVRIVI
jgi:molybdate-binding protein/DNA-binding transcriptional regulator YhcF (GntR family)